MTDEEIIDEYTKATRAVLHDLQDEELQAARSETESRQQGRSAEDAARINELRERLGN